MKVRASKTIRYLLPCWEAKTQLVVAILLRNFISIVGSIFLVELAILVRHGVRLSSSLAMRIGR